MPSPRHWCRHSASPCCGTTRVVRINSTGQELFVSLPRAVGIDGLRDAVHDALVSARREFGGAGLGHGEGGGGDGEESDESELHFVRVSVN